MRKWIAGVTTVLLCSCCLISITYADSLKSTNFQIDESFVGGSGLVQSSSPNFSIDGSAGNTNGVGESGSTNFGLNSSYITDGNPALAFAITSPNASFGTFSPAIASTATASFQVLNYTSYGYVVQVVGDTPAYGAHSLAAMSSNGPSQAGVEQFGINLVANTSPTSLGTNPNQGQFGFGTAAANYNTANSYRYISGETIASAPKSSGITSYTISYIINVSNLTPSGDYSSNQVLVCTGTY